MSKKIEEKEGFQKTKIGWLPDNWKVISLANFVELQSGFALSSSLFGDEGKKVLIPKNFTKKGRASFSKKNTKYSTETVPDKYICHENDLLVLLTDLTPSCELLGKPLLLKKGENDILLNQRIVKVSPKQGLDKVYLCHYFLSEKYHQWIKSTASGSTVKHSSNKTLLKTKVFLPPLPEQKKIAQILTTWDTAIEKLETLIQKKQELKKGLMQVLLTGKIRFGKSMQGFQKTKIGLVPSDWEITTLEKFVELQSGYALNSSLFGNEGMKILIPKNFTKNGSPLFTQKNTKYSTEIVPEKFICSGNDLLVLLTDLSSSCELLGKPLLLSEKENSVILNQRIVKVSPKKGLDKMYLCNYFLSQKYHQWIKSTASGSTVKHSSNKTLLKTTIPLPSLSEQKRIALVFRSLDSEIKILTQELIHLKTQKKGLMQKLLTGEVRIKI